MALEVILCPKATGSSFSIRSGGSSPRVLSRRITPGSRHHERQDQDGIPSAPCPVWRFFDPALEPDISHRRLPHWEQPGVCYFLTFRTADSLPAEVCEKFRHQRHAWLLSHGIDTNQDDWHALIGELPVEVRREYHKTWSREFHRLLDLGHGACELAQADIARIVVDALRHFAGERYQLGDFVIMPNHVHLLVQFVGNTRLKKQCYSWKHFTAREINLVLNLSGHFWQGETYDHIVRSEAEFLHYQKYIAENPLKAGLQEGFVLHSML